eukprot:533287_1
MENKKMLIQDNVDLKSQTYGSINDNMLNLLQHKNDSIGKSQIFNVIINMVNGVMMAVLVGLPYVFHSGLITSIIMIILFAFISIYSLQLLIISAKKCNVQNYEDLCEHLFGFGGYITVSISLLLLDFGICLSNLIILKDCITELSAIFDYHDNTSILLIISIFIVFPSCLPKDISKIETISKFSIFASILITSIIITEWIITCKREHTLYVAPSIHLFVHFKAIPQSLGITAFLFVCQDCSFLMYNTLERPTIYRWKIVTSSACFITAIIYTICGIFGYLLFGEQLESNILNNFDTNDILLIVGRIIYGLTAALTYPIAFFVVRHVCYAVLNRQDNKKINNAKFKTTLLYTVPLFALGVLLAVYVDNLGIVMSLSGSIPSVIISCILPPLCYLKTFNCEKKNCLQFNKDTVLPLLLLIYGIFIGIFSTTVTLMQQ